MTLDLASALAAIRDGDFERFDALQADRLAAAEGAARREADARQRLAAAAARLAQTEDGTALLEWMVARTLRRITFLVAPGLSADQVALVGAKREGANELAFEILRLVAEGHGETLAPRT